MDLSEWTPLFLKHQDLLKREIVAISPREHAHLLILDIEKKNGCEEWIVSEVLKDALVLINKVKKQGITCLNTKANFDTLVADWGTFSAHPTLKIIFAVPRSNERWAIVPAHHAAVADKASLKVGLQAMFDAVSQA